MLAPSPMRAFTVTVLCAVLFGGCTAEGIGASNFCDRYAALFCEGNTNCCATPSDMYATRAACESARKATCTVGVGVAFEDGRARFQSAVAGQILADSQTAVDACAPLPPLWAYDLVRGTIAVGGDCSPVGSDWSPTTACVATATCVLTGDSAGTYHGRCAAAGTEGTACTAETCASNLYCSFAGESGHCALKLNNGAFCTTNSSCVSGTCTGGLCGTASTGDAYCIAGAATNG